MDENNQHIIERLRHSAYEDGLAHYPGIEHDARIVCDIARAAPAWHRKPTGPGYYFGLAETNTNFNAGVAIVVHSDSWEVASKAFRFSWVYGPLPQPPEGE